MWTKGQSWLRRTYTSLAGMPTETPREVRFNFKIGSNGLQNSQNWSYSFTTPLGVFTQNISLKDQDFILDFVSIGRGKKKMTNTRTPLKSKMWDPIKRDPNPKMFEL